MYKTYNSKDTKRSRTCHGGRRSSEVHFTMQQILIIRFLFLFLLVIFLYSLNFLSLPIFFLDLCTSFFGILPLHKLNNILLIHFIYTFSHTDVYCINNILLYLRSKMSFKRLIRLWKRTQYHC